jgi:hypothetical protein
VEALSRKDATLLSAQIAVEFMLKKIGESRSAIANEFKSNMEKRLDERTDRNLINLYTSLKEPGFVPSKQALNLALKLLERLFKNDNDEDDQILESEEELDSNEPVSMADELSLLSKQAELPPEESNDFSKIKQEFALFQKTGKITEHLELIHEALCTIKPTSTDPERTFSVAANFCTKIRSRLK